MEIAVYGGSFNPPHLGHAMVAAWTLWSGRCEQVWLLPAFRHAFDKELASFELRVQLCQRMAEEVHPGILVCTAEQDLPVPSYTYNTLCALRLRHPEHRFRLVVGADTLDTTQAWHRWHDIEAEFTPIVVGRQGYRDVADAPNFPDISSTDIRARVRAGEPVDHLVTAGVRALIKESWT